ncbi:hypothetical protein [Halomonas sp.]|uniref:hypothetical protein n=1 Tax=Halomonas sp. TaxID=1486246 RepID=UPI003D12CBF1
MGTDGQRERFRSKLDQVKQILKGVSHRDTYKNLPSCDVVLIGHQHHFSFLWKEKLYSPILESHVRWERRQGLKCELILKPYSDINGSRSNTNFYRYNRIALFFKVIEKIESGLSRKTRIHDRLVERFWSKLFESSSAKRIAAIQPDKYMCRAARNFDIEIIDLQHGVICQAHPWYGKSFNKSKAASDLPTSFFVWDQESKNVVESWAKDKGCSVTVYGNQWVSRFLNEDCDDAVVVDALKKFPNVDSNSPVVLVSLQWGLENYLNADDYDGAIMTLFKRLVERYHRKYVFLVRLHPVQLYGSRWELAKKSLEDLSSRVNANRFDWLDSSYAALPAILSKTDVHLTFSSTVVKEAAQFNVPSAILDQDIRLGGRRSSYYEDLKEAGIVTVIEPFLDEVVKWIDDQLASKNKEVL